MLGHRRRCAWVLRCRCVWTACSDGATAHGKVHLLALAGLLLEGKGPSRLLSDLLDVLSEQSVILTGWVLEVKVHVEQAFLTGRPGRRPPSGLTQNLHKRGQNTVAGQSLGGAG